MQNRSVCQLLCEARGSLFAGAAPCSRCPAAFPVYGSSLSRSVASHKLAAQLAALQTQHGVQAFKVKVAQRMGHNMDVYPNRSQEVVAACRQAIGPAAALMVDANSGFTDAFHALQLAAFLKTQQVAWFEEPCVWNDLQCNRLVQTHGGLPVALGEQEYRLHEDWRLLTGTNTSGLASMAVVQPDVGYNGGLSRALLVAQLAHGAGATFVPHSPGATLTTLFTLHLMAALPPTLAVPHMEFGCVDDGIPKGNWQPGFHLQSDGTLALPPGPGWGASIDPSVLRAGSARVSSLGNKIY